MTKINPKKRGERKEAFFRILVVIIAFLIIEIWADLILILAIVNFFVVLFSGKRSRDIAVFSEYFNSYVYTFYRYATFNTNERPFPFAKLKKISKFEK